MSEFRARGRGLRGSSRGRGGPPLRGSFRGRGGYGDRDSSRGFSRGRGGFSRGRGGPVRHLSRDDEHSPPPRKVPMMSRAYDSDRGPPISRRVDRYEDSYERGPPPRAREEYSPPRGSARLIDRTPPPRSSFRDRDYGSSRSEYPSSRGDYLSTRTYSPPPRESGFSSRDSFREERRDTFSRSGPRGGDYMTSSRMPSDYSMDRSRESTRDYGSSRDYLPSRSEFLDSLNGRGDFRDRDYGSSRFSSRVDERSPRGPPREFRGRGGFRGGFRGHDERGGRYMGGRSRGRGPPRGGRGRPDFSGGRGRRSPPAERDAPPRKSARMDMDDTYASRR